MADDKNEIRISATMTAIAVLDETIGSSAYTSKVVDSNIGSVGGAINWTGDNGYEGASACKWSNVQIDVATATGLNTSAFNLGNVAPTGTIPVKVRALAVKYNKKTGTPGKVVVSVAGATDTVALCALDEGEGIAIPLNGSDGVGFAIANVKIHQISNTASNYGHVTVALLGHDGA